MHRNKPILTYLVTDKMHKSQWNMIFSRPNILIEGKRNLPDTVNLIPSILVDFI